MKDETKRSKTKAASTETVEPGTAKSSAKPKGKDTKNKAAAPEPTEAKIFGVIKGGKHIQAIPREKVIADLGTKYNDAQIEKLIEQRALMPSAKAIYCVDKDKLTAMVKDKGWDKAEPVKDAQNESKPLKGQSGEIVVTDDSVQPEPNLDDPNQPIFTAFWNPTFTGSLSKSEAGLLSKLAMKDLSVASLSAPQQKTWDSIKAKYQEFVAAQNTALVKDDAIQGIPEIPDDSPMTKDEKQLRDATVKTIHAAQEAFEKSPLVMAEGFSIIRDNRLYRETHSTLEQFAFDEFGITREYAQNLAQWGDFLLVLKASPISENLALTGSGRAVKRITASVNQVAEQLGIGKSEFEVMKPIIHSWAQVIADIATDEHGEVLPNAPRIIASANEVLQEVVRRGVVEIEGKQMTIEEAQTKGVLGLAVESQIVETVAEGIKANRQTIIDDARKRAESRTEPHGAVKPSKSKADVFEGVIPSYFVKCTAHPDVKDNHVVKVFNAGFELKCGDRYQLLVGQGDTPVCIFTDGKVVRYD